METIGQRIRRLRLERGIIRQAELALPCGITQSTLSDIESKNKEFLASVLLALCRKLDVSIEEIMYGTQGEIVGQSELTRIFAALSPADRDALLRMARGLQIANQANVQAA